MVINGIVRPQQILVEHIGQKQPRFVMVYQEPGGTPLPLCGTQVPDSHTQKKPPPVCKSGAHVSALQARKCATAVEWHRRLQIYGNSELEKIQAGAAKVAERNKAQAQSSAVTVEAVEEKKVVATPIKALLTGRVFGRTNNRVR